VRAPAAAAALLPLVPLFTVGLWRGRAPARRRAAAAAAAAAAVAAATTATAAAGAATGGGLAAPFRAQRLDKPILRGGFGSGL
jgi:hypothetical protein